MGRAFNPNGQPITPTGTANRIGRADFEAYRQSRAIEQQQKSQQHIKSQILDVSKLPTQDAYNQIIAANKAGWLSRPELQAKIQEIGDRDKTKLQEAMRVTPTKVYAETAHNIYGAAKDFVLGSYNTVKQQTGIGVEAKTSKGSALLNPKLVEQQINYIKSEAKKGTISQAKANAEIARLQGDVKTKQAMLSKAETKYGAKYDPDAGVMAAVDVASMVTGVPALAKALYKVGGKALATETGQAVSKKVLSSKPAQQLFGGKTAVQKAVEKARSIVKETPVETVPTKIKPTITTADIKTRAVNNLKSTGVEITPKSTAVESLRNHINYDSVKGSKQITNKSLLPIKGAGVKELKFDKDGNITLYRVGDIKPGEPNSFSLTKKLEGQKAYTINKDDILVNTNSKEVRQLFSDTYKTEPQGRSIYLEGLDDWVGKESEVIVSPTSKKIEVTAPQVTKTVDIGGVKLKPETVGINTLKTSNGVVLDKELTNAIKENGVVPLLVDKNNMIYEGQHRLESLKALGEKNVPIYRVDMADINKMSDDAKMEFLDKYNLSETKPLTPIVTKTPVGEQKVTGGAKKLEAQTGVTAGEKATYTGTSYKANKITSEELVKNNRQEAFKAMSDVENYTIPQRQEIYKSLVRLSKKGELNDVDIMRLKRAKPLSEQSEMGQGLGQSGFEADPSDPFKAIKSLADDRAKVKERRTGIKVGEETKKIVKEAKSNIKAPSKDDWSAFIDGIRCK